MSSFTNNGAFGTPFGRGDQPRRSYVHTGVGFNTSSWPSTGLPDPPFSVYGGGVWPCSQRLDEAHPGPSFGVPGGNGLGTNLLLGREVAAPVSEQAFPVVQRVLPALRPCSPFPNWTQTSDPPWQPTSSWDHPMCATGQQSGHSSSIGSLGMRPDIPPFRLAASSVTTGYSERRVTPTGYLPSIATPHSVRPSTYGDPVQVAPSTPRPRGERWDSLNTTTFQCMWTSGVTRCTALIAGDRRSLTSHLRNKHDFTCDDQMAACAWGECTTCMQRRNIPRHIVACHFEIKVTCSQCGLALSRADANKKHRIACTGAKTPAVVEADDDGRRFY